MNTEDTKVLEDVKLYSINLTDNPLPDHEITVAEDSAEVEAANAEPAQPQYRVTLDDLPKPPTLNRAQRRHLARHNAHKAALQARHVLAKRRRMAAKQAKIAKALAKQAKYAAGIIE